ncbi:hypothetical protein PVAND_000604 [Polypedilum vanderplanki]|uniref:Protein PET100 homolog, mitochondrial n=1 Tax=Polypedilum vanderplanki TaxID=319348 RepID=A0A9J6BKT3_POLVA|nr:hypothetical protein PVAND_000604 [Polypedilum vanderplanki]
MGGWKLEVFKMALYMSFPVALFHWFNQPEYFEKWVVETKRELYPPENKEQKDMIDDCIRKVREKHDLQLAAALKEYEGK